MGETWDFEAFYGRYARIVKQIAIEYLNDYYDAEDVSQDVFMKLLDRLDSFEEEGEIKAWLRVVTKNRAIDVNRKRHKNKVIYIGDYADVYELRDHKESIENYMLRKELLAKIAIGYKKLGEDLRNALSTHCTLDVSQEKASKTLGIEVGTYRVRLFRARKYLKKQFEKEINEMW